MNNKGYSFRIKRTGYIEVDSIIPSACSGAKGKGSCDAYVFSGDRAQDEKGLINDIARIIRGSEKIQKNKAFVMTVLASIYGQTKDIEISNAVKKLKDSQVPYEQILFCMWNELNHIVDDDEKIEKLYVECASELYELSQDRGMDLYGFIYEELAAKDAKKEQGEYYTPRHTIRPLIAAVFNNYLKWSKEELEKKNIADIFVVRVDFCMSLFIL